MLAAANHFGIKSDRMLLPIDLARCPFDIFQVANAFAKPFESELILLHVLKPGQEHESDRAQACLEDISDQYVRPTIHVACRVRLGVPHEEIIFESGRMNADLILLPTFAPTMWDKLLRPTHGETSRNLITCGACRIFVIESQRKINCFRRWGSAGLKARYAL